MIVYEVNLFVQRAIEAPYRAWLDAHIREILALPGFVDAQTYERTDPPGAPDELVLCVHYRLQDQAALDAYFRDHAARLRADGVNRFGDRFRAERRVLQSVAIG